MTLESVGEPMDPSTADLLASLRDQNLGVYRAMPSRVREDVGQESQIAQDYRGRLTYELLQNADDAMVGQSGFSDKIRFTLTNDALIVANSGRPLTEGDVAGLCGIGSTTKIESVGGRRASIGHKGMGFKSVLEITDRPEVYSTTHAFRLDARLAAPVIGEALVSVGAGTPDRVPTMRLPWPTEPRPADLDQTATDGFNTEFVFPLRESLTGEHRSLLAQRLLDLPVTSILFLKHLEDVEVTVDTDGISGHFRWKLEREIRRDGRWIRVPGFVDSAVYRVQISSDDGSRWGFLAAHDADVVIGAHRGGLDDSSWTDIELTEVSLAIPWSDRGATALPTGWAKLHVFLPTQEISPYPMLVNGAFRTDLSRQEIRVGDGALDYNRHLLGAAARVFREQMLPVLDDEGIDAVEILGFLDRTVTHASRETGSAATVLHEAMAADMVDAPFLRGEGGMTFSVGECVVPPVVSDPALGARFRAVLPPDATFGERWFPAEDLCGAKAASVLVDLGATALKPFEAATVLSTSDPDRGKLQPHGPLADRLSVDPVLSVLEGLWSEYRGKDRTALEEAARSNALFPVAIDDDGVVRRVTTTGLQCFYPPRSLTGEVPLSGLQFMLQSICWGDLRPAERRQYLGDRMPSWQGLFDVREFKFPDVMRASVLPGLELDPAPETLALRARLKSVDQIAAICQLAGRSANSNAPLPFERLGSNRALFNLSRLRVPCRPVKDGIPLWEPAYKVYFGTDWIEGASIETVLDAIRAAGGSPPYVPILASFDEFKGHLDQYRHLQSTADDADDDDAEAIDAGEVSVDEDEEAALESDERDRWVMFLTWLGVNRSLRPVSFQDVEDRGAGWLSTGGLGEPQGHAFRELGVAWESFSHDLLAGLVGPESTSSTAYFYRLHDLDAIGPLLAAAIRDETTTIARALYEHLATHWPYLTRFQRVQLAIVPNDLSPGKRTAPPKPLEDELREPGDDFWVSRLRRAPWVPSTHGPRPSTSVWLESAEVDRRFGRRGSVAGDLLPLLDARPEFWRGRSAGLASAIGVRDELSPATFGEDDARSLMTRVQALFDGTDESRTIDERTLREVIRPAYRNLIELLSGAASDDEDDQAVAPTLGDAPILVHDGEGRFRFAPAQETVYIARSSTRERLGGAKIESFILESSITARRPLRMLGIRTLEDELEWTPDPGEPALDEAELNRFHTGLSELAPYVLARLRAERADDRLAARDAAHLRTLLGNLKPVESLRIRCELDGQTLLESGARDAFFGAKVGQSVNAFVRWGEHGWPPTPAEADALATVLLDAIGAGAYEAFVALVRAETDEARLRLLRLAGAPTDLQEIRAVLTGTDMGADSGDQPAAAPTPGLDRTTIPVAEEWVAAPKSAGRPEDNAGRIPLYRPGDLLIDGVPIIVSGSHEAGGGDFGGMRADGAGSDPGGPRHQGTYGTIATDLTELDRVGMWVALTFERHRLRLAGHPAADVFQADQPADNAFVFDVSTTGAIQRAWHASEAFRFAFDSLLKRGIQRDFPGFDILTIDPADDVGLTRLIELKSSGVNARVQSMTWNEWKTARDSTLRDRFYLYLVSNLRRDLGDAKPYLRAIRDPFGSLWDQEVRESSVKRTIQLNVAEFGTAEELELQVLSSSVTS